MTSGFDLLERELVAAERRSAARLNRPEGRLRPRMGMVVPIVAVAVAVVVAIGALVALSGSSDRNVPSIQTGSPPTNPRQILGVLHRPRTAADQALPLTYHGGRGGYRLIRHDARIATTTATGQPVFVIPTTQGTSVMAGATRVVIAVGHIADGVSIADIESGRAAFSFSQTTNGPYLAVVLVPDGITRVVLDHATPSKHRLTATVHGNVAVFTAQTNIAIATRQMRWYSAQGTAIPIHNYSNPAPSYRVNAHGQTYGPAAPAGTADRRTDEPDLILAVGQRLHGAGHIHGYVLRSQLNAVSCANLKTPKAAVACTRKEHGNHRQIPLYAQNGTTVIGTFTTG